MSECPPPRPARPILPSLGPCPPPSPPHPAACLAARHARGPPRAHPLLALLTDPDCRGEDPEGQDTETERFLATTSTGRRVSFNEAALFEQSRKAQDKGRR